MVQVGLRWTRSPGPSRNRAASGEGAHAHPGCGRPAARPVSPAGLGVLRAGAATGPCPRGSAKRPFPARAHPWARAFFARSPSCCGKFHVPLDTSPTRHPRHYSEDSYPGSGLSARDRGARGPWKPGPDLSPPGPASRAGLGRLHFQRRLHPVNREAHVQGPEKGAWRLISRGLR